MTSLQADWIAYIVIVAITAFVLGLYAGIGESALYAQCQRFPPEIDARKLFRELRKGKR